MRTYVQDLQVHAVQALVYRIGSGREERRRPRPPRVCDNARGGVCTAAVSEAAEQLLARSRAAVVANDAERAADRDARRS